MARQRWDVQTILLALLTGLYFVILFRTAWVCDDAYITLRTVDNFVAGLGPRWNPLERVQAYTHPLWMLLLSLVYFATREAFYTTIMVSIATAGAAVVFLAWRLAPRRSGAILALLILVFSRAFIDYSTSGLENPLAHLLMVLVLILYLRPEASRRTLLALTFVSALIMLTRLDLLLLVLPPLIHAYLRSRDRAWALLGFAPLVIWEIFSLIYYGYLLPNTAYAKLSTGLPAFALLRQSIWYFVFSAKNDPITILALLVALVAGFAGRSAKHRALAIGLVLYGAYIVKIGGDFMGGRFFTVPLLCAVVILAQLDMSARRWLAPAAWIVAVLIGCLSLCPPILSGREYNGCGRAEVGPHGVVDERAYYYETTGLLRAGEYAEMPAHRWAQGGRTAGPGIRVEMNVGFLGYFAGPEAHVIDIFALADPLLAHLPALTFVPFRARNYPHDPNWRIGHFLRTVPEGYTETLAGSVNQFRDERLGEYYDQVALITRGELFSAARWRAIWRMNTGRLDHLIDRDALRTPQRRQAIAASPRCFVLNEQLLCSYNGVRVGLPGRCGAAQLTVGLDVTDRYLITLYRAGVMVPQAVFRMRPPQSAPRQGMVRCDLALPQAVRRGGFDEVGIYPLRGDGHFEVGPLALGECGATSGR